MAKNNSVAAPKKSRTSGKHSRTGCGTCKIRRVKCDETKPICVRCQKFGITCDGYGPQKTQRPQTSQRIERKELAVVIPPQSRRPSTFLGIPSTPPDPLINNGEEERYFAFFRDTTSFHMTPDFDAAPFRALILQGCHDPAVRHAVIALGALAKTSMVVQDRRILRLDEEIEQPTIHHRVAIQQYSKAIKMMRDAIAGGRQELRTTLLCCLLIICFECFHGNYSLADAHIQNGMNLIEDWRRRYPSAELHPMGFSSPAPFVIEDFLIQIFGRMEVQTFSFGDKRPPEVHAMISAEGGGIIQAMPPQFQTIEEARGYLELIIRRMKHWLSTLGAWYKPSLKYDKEGQLIEVPETETAGNMKSNLPSLHTIKEAIEEIDFVTMLGVRKEKYLAEFRRWNDALQAGLELQPHLKGTVGAILLILAYKTCILVLTTVLYGDEMVFDSHTAEMEEILDITDDLLSLLSASNPASTPTNFIPVPFTIFQGSVHPSYFVALSCRVPHVRKRAIHSLLNAPRREALCDSLFLGKVAQWVMGIEETYMQADGVIPKWARMHHIEIQMSQQKRAADVSGRHQEMLEDGSFVNRERKTTIAW